MDLKIYALVGLFKASPCFILFRALPQRESLMPFLHIDSSVDTCIMSADQRLFVATDK